MAMPILTAMPVSVGGQIAAIQWDVLDDDILVVGAFRFCTLGVLSREPADYMVVADDSVGVVALPGEIVYHIDTSK